MAPGGLAGMGRDAPRGSPALAGVGPGGGPWAPGPSGGRPGAPAGGPGRHPGPNPGTLGAEVLRCQMLIH